MESHNSWQIKKLSKKSFELNIQWLIEKLPGFYKLNFQDFVFWLSNYKPLLNRKLQLQDDLNQASDSVYHRIHFWIIEIISKLTYHFRRKIYKNAWISILLLSSHLFKHTHIHPPDFGDLSNFQSKLGTRFE